ncbi:hypothetical protein SAMN02745218_02883 [Desulfofundulus australicus DSM 11792]|uniref:Uncharacterized protein n=1 Tax=Desulfofundulus australicus DSM 11792 TaxID=1121425 RepID=A0A1M5DPP0_9FIRM|nr:hypothetical protein SAMN02745218_02883 [Desulfofundulus australicus DSM 11792]
MCLTTILTTIKMKIHKGRRGNKRKQKSLNPLRDKASVKWIKLEETRKNTPL